MSSLEEKLQEASLKGHDDISAVITDMELVGESQETILLSYRIGAGDGETIEATDCFDLPTEDTEAYEFVRLCRAAGVLIVNADANLVGKTVPVTGDGKEWSLVVPEFPDDTDTSEETTRDRTYLTYAVYTTVIVLFPLYALDFARTVYRDTKEDSTLTALLEAIILTAVVVALWLSVPLFGWWLL